MWGRIVVVSMAVSLVVTPVVASDRCLSPTLRGRSYENARQVLLKDGWIADRGAAEFDAHGEITCGTSGHCWANFEKDISHGTCFVDLSVDKDKDSGWVVTSQDNDFGPK